MLRNTFKVTAGVVALSMAAPAFANESDLTMSSFTTIRSPKVISVGSKDMIEDVKTSPAVQAYDEAYKAQEAYNSSFQGRSAAAVKAVGGVVGDVAIGTGKFAARKVANTIQEAAELSLAYAASNAYGYQAVDTLLAGAALVAAPVAGPAVLGTISGLRAMNTASEWIPAVRDVKHAGIALATQHYVIPAAKSVAGFAYDNAPAAWNATKTVASSAWNAVSSGWNALSSYYGG